MTINNKPFDLISLCPNLVVNNTSHSTRSYPENAVEPSLYIGNCGLTSKDDSMISRRKMQYSDNFNHKPSEEMSSRPEELIRSLSPVQLKILEYFLIFNKKHKALYPSQIRIAEHVGITREAVNRNIKKLRTFGLIKSFHRGVRRTSLYYLSPMFRNPFIRSALSHLLKPLMTLPLSMLIISSPITGKDHSRIINDIRNYNINNKHRVTMNNYEQRIYGEQQIISPQIRSIRWAQLTQQQQISLSIFPDEVIKTCSENTKYLKQARNSYAYFYKLCQNYCELNEIRPDYSRSSLLTKALESEKVKDPQKGNEGGDFDPDMPLPKPKRRDPFSFEEDKETAKANITSWQNSEAGQYFMRRFGNFMPAHLRDLVGESHDSNEENVRAVRNASFLSARKADQFTQTI